MTEREMQQIHKGKGDSTMKLTEKGCENLVEGIIVQATNDYRRSLRTIKSCQNKKRVEEAKRVKAEVERFFVSAWYSQLTNIDGKMIMKKIREEIDEE